MPKPKMKLARSDGWDFHTGKTINYRSAIGSEVEAPDFQRDGRCGGGIHIVTDANAALRNGATIPCSAYEVEPVGRVDRIDKEKGKARAVRVVREITDLDTLFGWRYSEAIDPVHPFKLKPPRIGDEEKALLRQWASVWASVRDSVRVSVWASVRAYIGYSVGDSVRDSVGASVVVYIGSLFPSIKRWRYVDHQPGEYPFTPGAELWRRGLVPSFDGMTWRLHGGPEGKVLYEMGEES